MKMIRTWVARSSTARMKLRLADSPIPRMFSQASSAITIRPPITSPGGWVSGRPERAQVVGHEEGRDRDREDVVEAERPAGEERDQLVERVAGEARGPARLGEHRRALGVRLGGQREQPTGQHEHHRREAERVGGDQAQRVVDRRAHVAVGGREQAAYTDAAPQSMLSRSVPSGHSCDVVGYGRMIKQRAAKHPNPAVENRVKNSGSRSR